jgi:diguanylate cyclase (GGDEF)-like protein
MPDCLSETILDAMQAGVAVLDAQGGIVAWNKWLAARSGVKRDTALGLRLDVLFPEIAGTRLQGAIEQALARHLSSMLTPGLNPPYLPLLRGGAGKRRAERMEQLIYVTPVRHAQAACLVQIEDVTATVRRERRLRSQSSQLIEETYLDPLTGVGNRRRFDQSLGAEFDKALKQRAHLAVIMFDIDHFKAYNDRHGHARGDACLSGVAQALQGGLRQNGGDMLARFGGEEFAVILPGADLATGCAVAERLRARVERQDIEHGAAEGRARVTVSAGVSAFVPEPGQDAHELISEADLALFLAKDEGRNRVRRYEHDCHEIRPCD